MRSRKRHPRRDKGQGQSSAAIAFDPVARRNSRLALGVAVFAAIAALAGVTPGEAARAVQRALNADKVDGISASRTPKANRLLALDKNKRFPASALRNGPRGPRGTVGPKGDTGERGPSEILAATKDAAVNAGTAPNTTVDVVSIADVPPGDYWAIGTTNVVYPGGSVSFFRCDLLVNGEPKGANSVAGMGSGPGGALAGWIIRQEPLNITVPATVKLRCFHESALDNGDGRYERSRLALIRTANLTVRPQP